MKKRNWIAGAIKRPGALRSSLGVKRGQNIPANRLAGAARAKGRLGKEARLAETLARFRKKRR